ncbi:MAG TPA: ATP-binding protein [Mobilitalea sp.]|nr:ATP-binding protein [Mobilitalea sp.]
MHTNLIPEEFYGMAATILSNIGDGVISTDLNSKIIYMNHMAEEILCSSADTTIGKKFDEVFTIYDVETKKPVESPVTYVLEQMSQTGLQNNTVLIQNQIEKYISATCTPIHNAEDKMVGVVVVFRDITRLKLYELNHINEENNLKAIFDNTPAGMIIVDEDFKILRANETVINYIHAKREDIIDMRFGESIKCIGYYENTRECTAGESCRSCEIIKAVKAAYKSNAVTVSIEIKLTVMKKGHATDSWFRLSVNPVVMDGKKRVAVTFVDISKNKLQEIHAREARDYVSNILNQLPFAVWMADEDFNWKYSNKTMDEISEAAFSVNPLRGWIEFIHPEDVEHFWSIISKAVEEKSSFIMEARVRIKDRGYRWGLISGTPYYENGKYAGYIGSTYDITERKEAEEDLKRYQDLLIAAKEAAEAANRAKSEFLANMSHEIRTPINGIVGMIDLTLLTDINDDQRDNLVTAKACANSLIKIVNDVLDFSKMEAGKMTLESMNFDLKELIEEVIRTHSPRVFTKGLELNYTFSSTIPRYLRGDPNRLRQILNNLISNAVKFTEHGEVIVTIKCIQLTKEEVELKFSVSDTGIGIAKDDLSKLFHSFSQIENTFTRKYGGTGLGLVITKQLVEMMGGKIEIKSGLGRGSDFYFHLKFKIGKPIPEKKQAASYIEKTQKPLHILLVEDDQINQKVICKMLLEKGHTVTTADNGIYALECFVQEKFDAILMDIQMPVMNGIDAAYKLKQMEGWKKHTPVIALTAYALPGDRERFLNMGMDAYVAKPIQMEELFSVLEQVTTKTSAETPHNVTISEDGEVIFSYEGARPLRDHPDYALTEIAEKIGAMNDEMEWGNISNIEKLASETKRISNHHDITDIKDTAFKIELAARRGNETEVKKYVDQINEEFKIYQGSNQ